MRSSDVPAQVRDGGGGQVHGRWRTVGQTGLRQWRSKELATIESQRQVSACSGQRLLGAERRDDCGDWRGGLLGEARRRDCGGRLQVVEAASWGGAGIAGGRGGRGVARLCETKKKPI
jgi:hypothetical protein